MDDLEKKQFALRMKSELQILKGELERQLHLVNIALMGYDMTLEQKQEDPADG